MKLGKIVGPFFRRDLWNSRVSFSPRSQSMPLQTFRFASTLPRSELVSILRTVTESQKYNDYFSSCFAKKNLLTLNEHNKVGSKSDDALGSVDAQSANKISSEELTKVLKEAEISQKYFSAY